MIHKKRKAAGVPAAFSAFWTVYVRKTGGTAISAVPLIFCTSMTVSRVLYLTVIYLRAALPRYSSHPGSGRANLYAPIPVLLRIEFTASDTLEPTGALLPHLSTFSCVPCLFRQTDAGSLFLLHFSSDRSGRALPVILALWSPDFPHSEPFGFAARLSVLLAELF